MARALLCGTPSPTQMLQHFYCQANSLIRHAVYSTWRDDPLTAPYYPIAVRCAETLPPLDPPIRPPDSLQPRSPMHKSFASRGMFSRSQWTCGTRETCFLPVRDGKDDEPAVGRRDNTCPFRGGSGQRARKDRSRRMVKSCAERRQSAKRVGWGRSLLCEFLCTFGVAVANVKTAP